MYDLSMILQLLVTALTLGCVYGLVGVGFTMIFNASGILNFAQGAFVMLGGMLTYFFYSSGAAYGLAAMAAIVCTAGVAWAMQGLIFNRLIRKSATPAVLILATLACHLIIENGTLQLLGDQPHTLPPFTPGGPLMLLGTAVSRQALWVIVASVASAGGLVLLYRYSRLGKAMRACAINPEVAQLMGIRVGAVVGLSFALSGALGAMAGVLITPLQFTAFFVGIPFAMNGFIAAVMGGQSPVGAMAGGLLLGLLHALAIFFLDAGYKDTIAFLVLILLLLLKPHGLFKSYVGH